VAQFLVYLVDAAVQQRGQVMTGKRVLVLGGGAPNLTLMSGALAAFHDQGLTFDVISMAGGGAVVGLSYLAPKGLTPAEALRNTMNFGVSDAIYSMLPINYKIFFKGGRLSDEFRSYWRELPPVRYAENQYGMSAAEKLESDLLLLAGSMMTPNDTNFFSQAICAHVPFIEDIVDFEKLSRLYRPRRFLNAYSIDAQKIVEFEGPDIDIRHFRAAFSFPFLYAPYEIDGRLYYEGAAFSCLNLVGLAVNYLKIPFVPNPPGPDADAWKFILFDVLGTDLIHPARDMMDAYAQSMIVPVVANAQKELAIFTTWVRTGDVDVPPIEWELTAAIAAVKAQAQAHGAVGGGVPNVEPPFIVPFPVPPEQRPYMLDWSRSNLERLFDIGYESGLIFLEDNPDV
jgi:NTE family protein